MKSKAHAHEKRSKIITYPTRSEMIIEVDRPLANAAFDQVAKREKTANATVAQNLQPISLSSLLEVLFNLLLDLLSIFGRS